MGFFYLKEPKKFNHLPIYYDENKETRDEIISNAKRELGIDDENNGKYTSQIKGKFNQQRRHTSINLRRREQRKSNIHLIFLVILLILIFYFFFL